METIIYKQKTNKIKNVQRKQYETKKSTKIVLWLFIGYLLLGMGPIFKCRFYTQGDAIGEPNFSFASGCQLEIFASCIEAGACVYFPLSVIGPSCLHLCRPRACCHVSLVLLCLKGTVSLVSSIPFQSFYFLYSPRGGVWGRQLT